MSQEKEELRVTGAFRILYHPSESLDEECETEVIAKAFLLVPLKVPYFTELVVLEDDLLNVNKPFKALFQSEAAYLPDCCGHQINFQNT